MKKAGAVVARTIVFPVKLDEKTFRRFAFYDAFRVRLKWRKPVIFCLIFLAFGVIAMLSQKAEGAKLAAVLIVVGIGLPLVYTGTFLSQVNMQCTKYKLKPPRLVYTLTLSHDVLRVHNESKAEEDLVLSWSQVPAAFRRRKCIYLYVTPQKAFLLPENPENCSLEEVWSFLLSHMKAGTCRPKQK